MCHAEATASPSHVSSRSARLHTTSASLSSNRACAEMPLEGMCWSVAQEGKHEENRGATGMEVSEGAQERAMPEPQPQQATWAPQVLSHGLRPLSTA